MLHMQAEAQVTYPTALLVGAYLKLTRRIQRPGTPIPGLSRRTAARRRRRCNRVLQHSRALHALTNRPPSPTGIL
jgi:hypothetical protein